MRVTRFMVNRVLAAIVVPALALLLVAPSPSVAQSPPYATIVAYEVAEHLRFKGGAGEPDNFKVRFAKATLLGTILQTAEDDAGNPFVVGDFFDSDAKSSVKATGTGTIAGTFNVLHDFDGAASMSLSTMEVAASGTVKGELDLRPTMQNPPQPFALVAGRWRTHGRHGTYSGVFLIPFPGSLVGIPPQVAEFVYPLGPGGAATCLSGVVILGSLCKVHEDEILLRFPLTKLEMFLYRD